MLRLLSNKRIVRADAAKVKFSITKPTYYGAQIRVVGSSEKLGAWDIAKGFSLEWAEGDEWTGECEITEAGPTEFKFAMVYEPEEPESEFEWSGPDGSNFLLEIPSEADRAIQIVSSWEGEVISMDFSSVAAPEPVIEAPAPVVAEEVKPEPIIAAVEEVAAPIPAPAPIPVPITAVIDEPAVASNIVEAPAMETTKSAPVKRGRKVNAAKSL